MDLGDAYLDGAQRLKNAIEKQFGSLFNAYFVGAPVDVIPDAAMPAIVFQKVSGKVVASATGTDDLTEVIMVHLLVNGKDGFGTPDDDNNVMRQLFTLVEGRDPDTANYMPTTIMGVIRQNFTLDETVINHDEQVNYDVTPRQDQPTVVECIITVTMYERVLVGNRT